MTERWNAIVIGAGHNGLVCATLLAKAGHSVLLLEANEQVGGAAVTREFVDGYSVSACAHLLYQLQPQVRRDLGLRTRLAAEDIATVALGEEARHVRYKGDDIDGVSDDDRERYRAFHKKMSRLSRLLASWLNRGPPRLGVNRASDLMALARMAVDLRALGKKDMREFLRLVGMNIHDELNERFYSPLLKGALSVDAVLGTHLGPRSPNTMLTYLYRHAGDAGRMSVPAGGMGSVTAALAHLARGSGVVIETGSAVERIIVENGRVTGVETQDGERQDSYTVVSSVDPKQTVFGLVGARHVETGVARRVKHVRCRGNAAKLHLALDGLPEIPGLDRRHVGDRFVIAPDEHYVERAFNAAKYGEFSAAPAIEMTIPSIHDETLAPPGKHVLSAVIQYAPYGLKAGWDDSSRAALLQTVMDTIARYLPGIGDKVIDSELLTPADIEREFRITGGHWHHAELALDQFMFVRPFAGASQYRTPLDGLYLCGAGTHPGGGVSGAPGRNAARAIIREKGSA